MLGLHAEKVHVSQAYDGALQQRQQCEDAQSAEIFVMQSQPEHRRVTRNFTVTGAKRQRIPQPEHVRLFTIGYGHLHDGHQNDGTHPDG